MFIYSPVVWVHVIACSVILGLPSMTSVETARRVWTCFSWIPCLLGVVFLFVISISSLTPICHFEAALYPEIVSVAHFANDFGRGKDDVCV
jgi:hypothetical protein